MMNDFARRSFMEYVLAQVGKPVLMSAKGDYYVDATGNIVKLAPDSFFDCSGLVVYVIKNTRQKNLPRTTDELGKYGKSLAQDTPAPGDLVFFNTLGESHSHVGIYVGSGRFVHAPTTGGTVRLDEIKNPYWAPRYTEARRVVNP
jgi:cell wall-associated NlpC family hydrolase